MDASRTHKGINMAETVTQGQFFQSMQDMDEKNVEQHRRLRQTVEEGFLRLERKLDDHARDDRVVADRVLVIETERKEEKAMVVRRSTWLAIAISSAITAAWKLIEHWVKP